MAAEVIIQLGDAEFWHDKPMEMRRQMLPVFEDQLKHLEELVPDFKIISAVVHFDEHSPHAHVVGLPVGRGYQRGMKKQVAKTRVFTQESLTELQDKMHMLADLEISEHPEIFEGENLKEIEKGRNCDWSKDYFIRQKAEEVATMDEYLADAAVAVSAYENTLEDLSEQLDKEVDKKVEIEAQKEFMRYAFLEHPKTPLGKLVSEAWRKFKGWWDEHKREHVKEIIHGSVLEQLSRYKKQVDEEKEQKRDQQHVLTKYKQPEL